MGVIARGQRLYIRFKNPVGKWQTERTAFVVGEEEKAKRSLRQVVDRIKANQEMVGLRKGPITLNEYGETRWFPTRKGLVSDHARDEAKLKKHIFPKLGAMSLELIRPRHLVDAFNAIRATGKLAPKTVHNVYGVLRALFRDAQIDGLIDSSPCILTEYQLGKNVDKKKGWRDEAFYLREELAGLLFDARISLDRRLTYGLLGVAGLRNGEAAALRWKNINASAEPLWRLTVAASFEKDTTKTGVVRHVPIHPTLTAMLQEWAANGWREMMGREPQPEDLVVPTPRPTNRGPRVPWGSMRSNGYIWKRLKKDLLLLGMRHRRAHDLRRTMISMSRGDGAMKDILRRATHKPSKEVIEGYTTFEWSALCREVSKLQFNPNSRYTLVSSQGQPMDRTAENNVEAEGIEDSGQSQTRVSLGRNAVKSSSVSERLPLALPSNSSVRGLQESSACDGVTSLKDRFAALSLKFGGGK